jgi:hypothetical protein
LNEYFKANLRHQLSPLLAMPLLKSEVYEEAKSAVVLNAEEVKGRRRRRRRRKPEAGGPEESNKKKITYVP